MLKAYLYRKDLARINKAVASTRHRAAAQKQRVPYLQAVDYQLMLIDIIRQQKYPYHDYSPDYMVWKLKKVGHLEFWQLFGDMLSNIQVWEQGGGWAGGLNPLATNRDGKNITKYATPNEKLRPLFGPSRNDYVASGKWEARGKAGLDIVGKGWQ